MESPNPYTTKVFKRLVTGGIAAKALRNEQRIVHEDGDRLRQRSAVLDSSYESARPSISARPSTSARPSVSTGPSISARRTLASCTDGSGAGGTSGAMTALPTTVECCGHVAPDRPSAAQRA
eukprot:1478100-Prymnesium_polylepis.1